MTGLSDLLRNHVDYTIWATDRLLNAGTLLGREKLLRDFGTADKSIQGTMAHVLRSEKTWLRRISGDSATDLLAQPKDEDWDGLIASWPGLHERWRAWAGRISNEQAAEMLDYTDLKGNAWQQPIWQIVLHVVNHSTHHRGQVSGFLRTLNSVPPPLDFILFMRSKA